MPIYEFKCSKCGHVFEYLHLRRDDAYAPCPICGEDKAEKLLSTFSSFSSSQNQGVGNVTSSSSCGSSGGFS
jgi:putative FmdB family regulatory protein